MRGSQLPIAEQLLYSGGPGMPGPYNSIKIPIYYFPKKWYDIPNPHLYTKRSDPF